MTYKVLAIVTGATGSSLIIYGSIAQGSPGMSLFLFGLMTLLIVPAMALLCRYRVTHGKRISHGTAVTGAFGAALLAFSITLIRVARLEVWTPEYWTAIIIGYGLFGLFGVLPALGVVRHYRARSRR